MIAGIEVTAFVAGLTTLVGLCIYSSVVSQQIIRMVNSRRPRSYSEWWWSWQKQKLVFDDYRALYPAGRLIHRYWTIVSLAVLILVGLAVALFWQ